MTKAAYISKAHLYRYKLNYKHGAWTQRGKFTTNVGLTGTFTLLFFNGYQNEYYVFFYPKDYEQMDRQTFLSFKYKFNYEVIQLIRPKILSQIEEIRAEEEKQITTDFLIQPLFVNKNVIKVVIEKDSNKQLTFHYNTDINEWVFYMLNLDVVANCFNNSCWLRDVWNLVQEHKDMKFPLLLHTP